MHHVALVRSVHHKVVDHNAGAYYALTGREPFQASRFIIHDEPYNFPPGRRCCQQAPTFVVRTMRLTCSCRKSCPTTAMICPANEPVFWELPTILLSRGTHSAANYQVPGLRSRGDASGRLEQRRALRRWTHAHGDIQDGAATDFATHYRAAWELLATGDAARFRIEQEPLNVRERYGLPDRMDRSVEARPNLAVCHISDSACCWPED